METNSTNKTTAILSNQENPVRSSQLRCGTLQYIVPDVTCRASQAVNLLKRMREELGSSLAQSTGKRAWCSPLSIDKRQDHLA